MPLPNLHTKTKVRTTNKCLYIYFNFLTKDINKSLSYIQSNRSIFRQEATKGEPLTSFLNYGEIFISSIDLSVRIGKFGRILLSNVKIVSKY